MASQQSCEVSAFVKLKYTSLGKLNIGLQFPQAVSGLGTHVPAPSVAPTNIFVPPFVQDVPQPVYQPQPPHYMPPINAFPHDNHSHQCGGHGHSHDYRGGESFLEIPQDHSVPAWDVGHYHQSSSADGLFGWFSNVGNKVFEKTKVYLINFMFCEIFNLQVIC